MTVEPLSDDALNELREMPKFKVSASRERTRGQHVEQQFDCLGRSQEEYRFLVFKKWHPLDPNIFSVGLVYRRPGGDLNLCRYNGSWHAHYNVLERESIPATFHIHTTTAAYLRRGYRVEGYAKATTRYQSVEEALRCLCRDCSVSGILPDNPPNGDLFDDLQ